MVYNPDADNVACHTFSCDRCGVQTVMVNGKGKMYHLNSFEIRLVEGEFEAKKVVSQVLCQFCLVTLNVLPKAPSVVVGRS